MRTIFITAVSILVIFSQVQQVFAQSTPLNGTYTIGPGGTYASLTTAVGSLVTNGISGPVVFNIKNGEYNEQIIIPEIAGSSVSNTVTFQSESMDSTRVKIYFASDYNNNYIINLNGADHLIFRKLTIEVRGTDYARAVLIDSSANYNRFESNIIRNQNVDQYCWNCSNENTLVYSNSGITNDYNTFRNNIFENGAYGFYFSNSKSLTIAKNIFTNQIFTSIYIQNQDSIVISNNSINTISEYWSFYAIYASSCTNYFGIEKNKIFVPKASGGIILSECNGSVSKYGSIANNFVTVSGIPSESDLNGVNLYNCSYTNIINNSILLNSPGQQYSSALKIYYGNQINLKNNILNNSGDGYAIEVRGSSSIETSDYNNLFTTGNTVASWENDYNTLSDLQLNSGLGVDLHSVSVNPYFATNGDLHISEAGLNGKGIPDNNIKDDIDGQIRNLSFPDIGADEFTPPQNDAGIVSLENPKMPFERGTNNVTVKIQNFGLVPMTSATINWTVNGVGQPGFNWSGNLTTGESALAGIGSYDFSGVINYTIKCWTTMPNGIADVQNNNDTIQAGNLVASLSGTYTIGGSNPDFANIQEATFALGSYGIINDVIFKIRNGTYNEQLGLGYINGLSDQAGITFESESGDSTKVILTFSSSYSWNNYVILLNGADYITFNKLTFTALNPTYGVVVDIRNGSNYNTFKNCIMNGVTYWSSGEAQSVIYSTGFVDEYNSFINNRIIKGSFGIFYNGGGSNENGTKIENNIFENQSSTSIRISNQNSPIIQNNSVSLITDYGNSEYYGITCSYCNEKLIINKNKIYLPNNGTGIRISACNTSGSVSGLTSNNFITIGGTGTAIGISSDYSERQEIYNNNINILNTNNNGRALNLTSYINTAASINILNNIFANSGGGYSYFANSPSVINISDYNDLYTTGQNLGYWLGNKTDLSLLKSASGKDIHSISIDPQFFSDTDLHVKEVVLNNAGTPLAAITDDIDGDLRNALKPDIGADEFNLSFANEAGLFAFKGPVMPFTTGNSNVTVILKNYGSVILNNVAIDWKVNNSQQTRFNWSGTLASGDTARINIGTYSFNLNTNYTVTCWTSQPNGQPDPANDNDTVKVSNLYAGLNGTYTIGGVTPDFQNFTEAVSALNLGGITGKVIINVRAGTYNEQISLLKIQGATKNNNISFTSETGDSTSVILGYTADAVNNYTLQFNGAEYIWFNKINIRANSANYGNVIDIRNESKYISISNCILQNSSTNSIIIGLTASYNCNYNSFVRNKIINGGFGISCSLNAKGTRIENNIFENQQYYGMSLNYQDSLVVKNNILNTNSVISNFTAIYCDHTRTQKIERNQFFIPNGGNGIQLVSINGGLGLIANNFIYVGGTSYSNGIICSGAYNQGIFNNTIHIANTNLNSRAFTIYDNNNYSTGVNLKNNILCNTGGGYALYSNFDKLLTASDYNDLFTTGTYLAYWTSNKANLAELKLASNKDSHSISVDPEFYSISDLHIKDAALNNTGIPLADVGEDIDGEPRSTVNPDIGADEFNPSPADGGLFAFGSLKIPFASGNNKVIVSIKNYGADTLKTLAIDWRVNNIAQARYNWSGTLVSGDTLSINLGTFTFNQLSGYTINCWTTLPNGLADFKNDNDTISLTNIYPALNGNYTIGGLTPSFQNLNEAVVALNQGGIVGPVVFKVRAGTYTEQIVLPDIIGTGITNPIIFESESGDSTSVVIRHKSNEVSNYTIQLNKSEYTRFNKMTILADDATNGTVIELKNYSSHNVFSGCILRTSGANSNIVNTQGSNSNYTRFENNRFIDGHYAISLSGLYYDHTKGAVIENNSFENQAAGALYLYSIDSLAIHKNSFTTNSVYPYFTAIYCNGCNNNLRIEKNKIIIPKGGYGIQLNSCYGKADLTGMIVNNFIQIGGSTTASGINCFYSHYQNFYNNSISLTNTEFTSSAFQVSSSGNIDLRNNILYNLGGGYALYSYSASQFRYSDYNDLYAFGTNLAFWGANFPNLTELKLVSGMNMNSISVDPKFISLTDLHVKEIALNSAGVPVNGVSDDIDGDTRDANFPDIGADEFENRRHDIGITAVLPASGCSLTSNESVTVTIKNFGAYTESGFNVAYILDNSLPVIENFSQSIPAGSSSSFTFSKKANLSHIGTFQFRTYSDLSGEEYFNNDTLESFVSNMPKLNIKLSNDTAICADTYVTLIASGADSYLWNNGATTAWIQERPVKKTTYIVKATNYFNCEDTDTVTVSILSLPASPVITASGPVSFCNDSSVVLTSSINHNLKWSTDETTPSITVSKTESVYVMYTDSLGCSSSSGMVYVTEEKSPVLNPRDTTICSAVTVVLRVQNAAAYSWSNGASSQSISVSPAVTSTYTVTATTTLGCSATFSSTINVIPPKTPGLVSGLFPATGTDGLSLPLGLSWMPASNSTNYDLYVWPEDQAKPANAIESNINGIRTTLQPNSVDYGKTYNWQVISKYYGCASTPGPVQAFRLRYLPDLVVKNVQIPSTAFTGQEIEVTWDVKNQGLGNTANQVWEDFLSLSLDTSILDDFAFLGNVRNMTYLEPGQSYSKKASFRLPLYKDGVFGVFAWADRRNSLLETDNLNNQGHSSNTIWVKLTPPPDLFVNEIISPSDFFSEDTINLSYKVINKGKWPTETNIWTDRVYISKDFDTSKKYHLADFVHKSDTLMPEATYIVTIPVAIPEGIFGRYYFYVETDFANNVQEHAYDGNNLTQSDSTNVILRPPADLEVSDIVIPKSATNIGTALIQWNVANIGNSSPLDKGWNDMVYLSKLPVFDAGKSYAFPFRRTAPGGIPQEHAYNNSENIQIPNNIVPGDYYVYIKTDGGNEVFEYTFEENNMLRSNGTIKITIAPWPDLIVSELSLPDSAAAGDIIPVSYTVTNRGSAPAKGGWKDRIFFDTGFGDKELKEIKRYDVLNIDASYNVNTQVEIPAGLAHGSQNYKIYVHTDANNSIYEHTDEYNNKLQGSLFIVPSDLSLISHNIPSTLNSGSDLSISMIVKNTGVASTPAYLWFDKVEILDSLYHSISGSPDNNYSKGGPVKPGNSYTLACEIEIPDGISGNYYIRLTSDISNKNNERNSLNNSKIVPVKIILRSPTDLTFSSFSLPTSGIAGQPLTINWSIKNSGPGATLAKNWSDRILLSKDSIINANSDFSGNDISLETFINSGGLNSGGNYIKNELVYIPISAVGNYYVMAATDYYNEEYEFRAENNNTAYSFITISLAPPSDLVVTDITVPAGAITGEPVTIGWTLKNLGPNKAKGYLTDMVYFSKDTVWDIDDQFLGEKTIQVDLNPDEVKTSGLTTELTGTSEGTYYIIVRTDNKNNINEVFDYNNTLSSVSTVNVEIPVLKLNVTEEKVLFNSKGLYYRIEIPDSLTDETLLITLKGDSINGANELFISYDKVPDRSDHDFTSRSPFNGNQEVLVPSLQAGKYYLLVYGSVSPGTQQDISILAGIVNFQIRSVEANNGGNKGSITTELYGAKFTPGMQVVLQNSSHSVAADSIIFMDATRMFVTFNLSGAPLGYYDVFAVNAKSDTTILHNGFEVVESSPFGLVTSVKAPGAMRLGTSATIAVQFANEGNNDIPIPVFKLISIDQLPVAFTKKELSKNQTELEFELRETYGPQHVIRPGAVNSLYIWVYAKTVGLAHFRFE